MNKRPAYPPINAQNFFDETQKELLSGGLRLNLKKEGWGGYGPISVGKTYTTKPYQFPIQPSIQAFADPDEMSGRTQETHKQKLQELARKYGNEETKIEDWPDRTWKRGKKTKNRRITEWLKAIAQNAKPN